MSRGRLTPPAHFGLAEEPPDIKQTIIIRKYVQLGRKFVILIPQKKEEELIWQFM